MLVKPKEPAVDSSVDTEHHGCAQKSIIENVLEKKITRHVTSQIPQVVQIYSKMSEDEREHDETPARSSVMRIAP